MELGHARLRLQRRVGEGEQEDVGQSDVVEDLVPPGIATAQVVVIPDLAFRRLEPEGERLDGLLVVP